MTGTTALPWCILALTRRGDSGGFDRAIAAAGEVFYLIGMVAAVWSMREYLLKWG